MRELVHQRAAAYHRVVVNFDFAGKLARVGDYQAVVQDAVVTHVHVCHQQIVVADDGASLRSRAAVDGHELADGVVVANLAGRLFALEFKILRHSANHSVRKHPAILADARAFANHRTAHYSSAVANHHVFVYCHKRTYLYVFSYFRFRMYACQWLDHLLLTKKIFYSDFTIYS